MKSILLTAVVCAGSFFALMAFTPVDDTDGGPFQRSNMRLFTDYGTGCQYLNNGIFVALTPRMGPDGKQVCKGAKR